MKLILENWQNFINKQQSINEGEIIKMKPEQFSPTDREAMKEFLQKNGQLFKALRQITKQADNLLKLDKSLGDMDLVDSQKIWQNHIKGNKPLPDGVENSDVRLIKDSISGNEYAEKFGPLNGYRQMMASVIKAVGKYDLFEQEMSPAMQKLLKDWQMKFKGVEDSLNQMINKPLAANNKLNLTPVKNMVSMLKDLQTAILDVKEFYEELPDEKEAAASTDKLEAAVNKAAEKAKNSENPEQQINQDTKTIVQNLGRPDKADKIKKAIEDKVEATSGQETEGGTDPEKIDPDPEKLESLKGAYINFRDNFYKQSKLREQAKLVNSLLAALAAFNKEEEAEAFGKRKDRERKVTSEAVEGEVTAKPKDIKNFKASVRSFRRAIRASKDLVGKATEDTDAGKLIGASSRARVVKFATETQKRIKMLNDSINAILKTEETSRIDEKFSPDVQAQLDKYKKTLDTIEDVYEVIVGTDLDKGGLDDIITNLEKGTEMEYAEIEKGVKKALELLSTIKGYFPSIVPFEGGKIEATQIVTEYEAAIRKLNLSSSDIQSLNDALEGEQGKVTILNFQDRLIEFSGDIEKIFGIPGLKEKDSAEPGKEREGDETEDKKDDEEESDIEALKDGAETAKRKYENDEFIQSLKTEEEKTAFYYLISYFTSKGVITENIANKIKKELGEALKVLELFNPKYSRLIKKVLGNKERANAFVKMLQRVDAEGMDETKVSFNSAINIGRFFEKKLFRNALVKSRIKQLGLEEDQENLGNLKKFLVYMLASDADFISGPIEESFRVMLQVGDVLADTNNKKTLLFLKRKEPELYKWAKTWFGQNKVKAKKLFEAIKEYIGKKEFVFNTKGLTLAKLQKLDFKGPALDIPEKEEELVKQTIEKVKDRLEGQYGGKSKELKSNTIQDVISVINKDSNSNMFSWSTQQSPSGIASTLDYLYSEVSPEDTEVFQTTDTEIIPKEEQLKTQWTNFFDEQANIDFYKKVNSLYKNVDEKTRGRFGNTEAWLDTASQMQLQENKKFGNPEELKKDFIMPIGNFITKVKKKDLGDMSAKQIVRMFAMMSDYTQKFASAWKFAKGDEKLPVRSIGNDSPLQGLEALAAKLKPEVEKIISQPKNQGKSSDELYDELEQIFKDQKEAENLSDKQVDQVVKKAVDDELEGLEALAAKLKPYVEKIINQPENQGKSSDELYDELEQVFKDQEESEDLSNKQVDQVVKKAVDDVQDSDKAPESKRIAKQKFKSKFNSIKRRAEELGGSLDKSKAQEVVKDFLKTQNFIVKEMTGKSVRSTRDLESALVKAGAIKNDENSWKITTMIVKLLEEFGAKFETTKDESEGIAETIEDDLDITIAGCLNEEGTESFNYNVITGRPCPDWVKAPCVEGDKFNVTTGKPCPDKKPKKSKICEDGEVYNTETGELCPGKSHIPGHPDYKKSDSTSDFIEAAKEFRDIEDPSKKDKLDLLAAMGVEGKDMDFFKLAMKKKAGKSMAQQKTDKEKQKKSLKNIEENLVKKLRPIIEKLMRV